MSLAIWGGDEVFIIGDEGCKEGDPVVIVAITHDNVIEWIRALTIILEDGELRLLPGEMGKCDSNK